VANLNGGEAYCKMDNRIIQICIEGQLTGVIGLEETIKAVADHPGQMSDSEIAASLLTRIQKLNYVPLNGEEAYRKALLHEYKKYLGEEVEAESPGYLEVVVLGPGCYQCTSLETDVRNIMAEMDLAGDLRHVTDPKEIGSYGVMGVPALIINGKVVAVGSVPEKKKIQQWLSEAAQNIR
jgi:hypothetical protein